MHVCVHRVNAIRLLAHRNRVSVTGHVRSKVGRIRYSITRCPRTVACLLRRCSHIRTRRTHLSSLVANFISPGTRRSLTPATARINSRLSRRSLSSSRSRSRRSNSSSDTSSSGDVSPRLTHRGFTRLHTRCIMAHSAVGTGNHDRTTTRRRVLGLSRMFGRFHLIPGRFSCLIGDVHIVVSHIHARRHLVVGLYIRRYGVPGGGFVALFANGRADSA